MMSYDYLHKIIYTKTKVNRIPLRCITLHYITLHCAALNYITLPNMTVYYLTLPDITYKTKPYLTLPYHTTQSHKIPTIQYPSITSHYITWQATTAAQNTQQYMCMLIQLRPTHTHTHTHAHTRTHTHTHAHTRTNSHCSFHCSSVCDFLFLYWCHFSFHLCLFNELIYLLLCDRILQSLHQLEG